MANSSLQRTGDEEPVVTRGHGTRALGPSDSSDTGSDIAGGPGLNEEDGLDLDRGTTSDPDVDGPGADAGADLGDADLDSDTDRYGTGERAAAGRDSTLPTDEIMRERALGPDRSDETPHDFSDRRHPDRVTTQSLDDAMDDDAIERLESLDEQPAPEGGAQPGLIPGGTGGPGGTRRLGGKTGPGSGRNPGRR